MEKSLPSESFIIIFVPDESYVDSVVSNPKFADYFIENIPESTKLAYVYHSSESLHAFTNKKYLSFMKRFGPNVKHIIDCRELNTEKITKWKCMVLPRHYNSLIPRLYPIAALNLTDYQALNQHIIKALMTEFNILISEPGLAIELYPEKCAGVITTDVITHSTYCGTEQQTALDDIEDKFKSQLLPSSQLLKDINPQEIVPETEFTNEPEIYFVGTISMKPNGKRCASCIYVNVKGNHPHKQDEDRTKPRCDFQNSYGIMMDCSEGTFGQLYDHFQSIETVRVVLSNLRVIFITHMHGDHHMGLLKVLFERDKALQALFSSEFVSEHYEDLKIFVIIPHFMQKWLEIGSEHFAYKHLIKVIHIDRLNPEPEKYFYLDDPFPQEECKARVASKCEPKEFEDCLKHIENMEAAHCEDVQELNNLLQAHLGIKRLYAVEAFHCYEAYGWVIEADDWRIFYSGDSKPNQNYVNYGKGTTLLIHEATLENGMEEDAASKGHTTTGQAIDIALKMGAWRACLTHFSPRYNVAEVTKEHYEHKVMNATDHFRLKLSDFEWAYKTLEMFELFQDD